MAVVSPNAKAFIEPAVKDVRMPVDSAADA